MINKWHRILRLSLVMLAVGSYVTTKNVAIQHTTAKVVHAVKAFASWYELDGQITASGVPLDVSARTAAHRTLPFGTLLDVTDLSTGVTIRVKVIDRGPFVKGRDLDLTPAAFLALHHDLDDGVASVTYKVVGP